MRLAAERAGVPELHADDRTVTLKWPRVPDRHALSVALQTAGLRPTIGSNQARIPVAAGRDPIDVALRALEAIVAPSTIPA